MSLVKGPFNLTWGANTLLNVSQMKLNYKQDSKAYTTTAFQTYTVDTAISASVVITLLKSDVAALAAILPQYYVAAGGALSTGETVSGTTGVIDLVAASCTTSTVYNDLNIVACGALAEVFRLKHARTRVDSIDFADNAVRTVAIEFIGEPDQGVATVQFFKTGTLPTIS